MEPLDRQNRVTSSDTDKKRPFPKRREQFRLKRWLLACLQYSGCFRWPGRPWPELRYARPLANFVGAKIGRSFDSREKCLSTSMQEEWFQHWRVRRRRWCPKVLLDIRVVENKWKLLAAAYMPGSRSWDNCRYGRVQWEQGPESVAWVQELLWLAWGKNLLVQVRKWDSNIPERQVFHDLAKRGAIRVWKLWLPNLTWGKLKLHEACYLGKLGVPQRD